MLNTQNGPIQYASTSLNTAQHSEEITIDAVELVNAEGLSVVDAWVLPMDAWESSVVTGGEIAPGEFDGVGKVGCWRG